LDVVTVTPENETDLLVHDAHAASPTTAFALSRLTAPTPVGVFRRAERPVYDTALNAQLDAATDRHGKGDLTTLLTGTDTWTVLD
ncbi:2-oxoacid:ferredoxin oxidoreductase subunit beta, partial [Streptomyces sp. NPDC001034]